MSKLGPILRQIRLGKKIKQSEYARVLGLSAAQMSKLEAGIHEPLESTTLKMLDLIIPEVNIKIRLLEKEVANEDSCKSGVSTV